MYEAQNFDHLIGTPGFSDALLQNHFTLYTGYVKNTNLLLEELKKLEIEKQTAAPQYAELKRRFGWEFNGMRLHELYFQNMRKNKKELSSESSALEKHITVDFGFVGAWLDDVIATGSMRGVGWVVTYYDPIQERLFNAWINEHDTGHLAGCAPILIMDVFEHAFMLDYGLKRKDYIMAFCDAIDWEVLAHRFDSAQKN